MRSILFVLLAAVSFSAHAQLAEWADQRSEEIYFEHALPVGGGRWAVMGSTSFGGSHVISVRNTDGTIAWEDVDVYFTGQGLGEVVLLPDSGLLHVGTYDGCDFYGTDSRVRRYAADGTLIWEKIIQPQQSNMVTIAAKGSFGLVAVASWDSVYVMDMDGDLVGGFQTESPYIQKIVWATDSTLLIVKGTDLHLVGIDGTELVSTPIGSTVMDMQRNGEDLFVLANDSVRRFSVELASLGIEPLLGLDLNSSFVISENGLFVNTSAGLYQLAADGTPAFLFSWPPLPNMTTTGCALRDSVVFSMGNTNISGRSTGIIRTLSMNGDAPQHDQDVEVLLHVDSAWTEFMTGPYWKRRADITGFVVNLGSDTLHSVVLSMWVQVPYLICVQPTNRIDTAGFALAPGDTLSLPFGHVDVALYVDASQAVGEGEICIVALAPDHLADRAPEDNTACASVDFVLGVEGPLHNSPLILAPNPVNNTCVLSGLAALGAPVRLTIMDLTGRIVAERSSTTSNNSMELDLSGLPSTAYILRAEGGRGSAMVKLVVARY